MGTYTLSDSITGEAIPEDTEVIAFLLTDGGSDSTESFLFARASDRYKLASLPIPGKWNGNFVTAVDDNSMAVRSALFAADSKADSFCDLQEELYTSSKKDIPSPLANSPFFKDAKPSVVTFSMFVTKPSSIDLIVNNREFSGRLSSSMTQERAKVDALLPLLISQSARLKDPDEADKTDAYMHVDQLTKTIFFETGDYRFEGFENPLTAYALSSGEEAFNLRLRYFLKEHNLFGPAASRATQELGGLPAGYDEVFTGLYQAQVMAKAMKFMSLSFSPATSRHRPYKDASRIEVLRHLLQQEIETYLEQVTDDYSSEALRDIDTVLGPLRSEVASLVKTRNSFAAQIERLEKKPWH